VNDYSAAEIRLMKEFKMYHIVYGTSVTAPQIYRMMSEEAFLYPERYNQDAIESLRRCCRGLMEGTAFRMTPEWDEMISV